MAFSFASFRGIVPFSAGTEYLGLGCDDGVAETFVLPFVKGPFVGVEIALDDG